jgi:NAD(P)H dehydrogenase (quinone)
VLGSECAGTGVAESAARILMEGPTKHSGKDYWFSADVLTAKQVAETLAEATGRKFTAAVRTAEAFQSEAEQPSSIFEPAYAEGGLEFFRYSRTEEWRTLEA